MENLDVLYKKNKNNSNVSVMKYWTSWSFSRENLPSRKEITSYHDEIGPYA